MLTTGFVEGRHPGSDPEFWRKACESGTGDACQTWARLMNVSCQHGSGLACLTLGVMWNEGRGVARDRSEAGRNFARACDLGMPYACPSLAALVRENGPDIFRPECERGDGESCFILASLYYAGGGVPKDPAQAVALFRKSCASGWSRGCGGLAECYRAGKGTAADAAQASVYFEQACRGGVAASCFAAATMSRHEGRGAGPGEVPAGLRSEHPVRNRERGLLPARPERTEGRGLRVLFASPVSVRFPPRASCYRIA